MSQANATIIKGIIYGGIASLIWGAWPVFSVLGTQSDLQVTDLTVLRFGIAGSVLLPVLLFKYNEFKQHWKRGVLLSIGAGLPYILLAMEGLSYAPSAHFGIITPSSMLIFTSIGSYFWLKEKTDFMRVLGVFFILIGITVVAGYSVLNASTSSLRGDLMFVGCGCLWASYTLLCRHWNMNSWFATAQVSVISMVLYLPFYLLNGESSLLDNPFDLLLFHGVFQGVLVAVVALYCYSKAVFFLGAAKGAIFSALVPLTSLLFGYFMLDERLSNTELMGLGAVCVGMILAFGLLRFSTERNGQTFLIKNRNFG